mgnify:CR=1 FL=1
MEVLTENGVLQGLGEESLLKAEEVVQFERQFFVNINQKEKKLKPTGLNARNRF